MPLQGSIKVTGEFTNSIVQSLTTVTAVARPVALLSYLDGTGLSQANKLWSPLTGYSVAQSTNTDIDLSGTLAGTYGAVVFTAIKGIFIKAGDANLGNLVVGNVTNGIVAPFGAATHSLQVQPGGVLLLATPSAAGWPITAATADLLRIAAAATTGTYTWDILVWGI